MAPVEVIRRLQAFSIAIRRIKNTCAVFYQISTDRVLARSLSNSWVLVHIRQNLKN